MSGLDEIFANMDRYASELENKVDQAVQGAGIECEGLAKQACPVDTGRLRSSIKYTKQGEMECTVDTNVNYAQFVELGTYKAAAQPFLFPAFQIASQHLLDELKGL